MGVEEPCSSGGMLLQAQLQQRWQTPLEGWRGGVGGTPSQHPDWTKGSIKSGS